MRVLGIDPGVYGGLAVVDEERAIEWQMMPSCERGIHDAIQQLAAGCGLIVIEDVPIFGMDARKALIAQHGMFGFIRACALQQSVALDIPWMLARPIDWQKSFGCIVASRTGEKKADRKNRKKALHIEKAMQMFPGVGVIEAKQDGIADALLVARWGIEQRAGAQTR